MQQFSFMNKFRLPARLCSPSSTFMPSFDLTSTTIATVLVHFTGVAPGILDGQHLYESRLDWLFKMEPRPDNCSPIHPRATVVRLKLPPHDGEKLVKTDRFLTNSKTCQMTVFTFSNAMIWQDLLISDFIQTFWRDFHQLKKKAFGKKWRPKPILNGVVP